MGHKQATKTVVTSIPDLQHELFVRQFVWFTFLSAASANRQYLLGTVISGMG